MLEKRIQKEYDKKWRELTLSDNFIFQKFMLNPENCKKILSEILGVEVEKVEYPVYEKVIDIRADSKSIRLDVYVKGDDTIYNVEMQCSDKEPIPKRSRYYQDLIDLDLLEKGTSYSELNRVFVIFICTFDYYGKDRYKYTFNTKCEEVEGLLFGDEITKIIVNTKGTVGEVSDDFKDFLKAINGEFKKSEYSDKIKSEVEKIKSNDIWRREYMTLYLREQLIMREYMEKGMREGMEKGMEKGMEEGMKEATQLAIRNMLKKLSVEDIIELGYNRELVTNIAEENK